MSSWKNIVGAAIDRLDNVVDRFRINWREQHGYKKTLKIVPYLGYGTNEKVFLRGRVVAEKHEVVSSETDGRRRNLRNFLRRFKTDEVPFASVRARYQNSEKELKADNEGYFNFELDSLNVENNDTLIREIELELITPVAKNGESVRAVGKVLVPSITAKFGVISDLDDTVITTNVSSKLQMLLNTALRNEYTRLPFEGVAAFYKALEKGNNNDRNPFFYVSSSPWNLYPFLVEFLRLNEIPGGALFLKDFGNHTIFNSSDHSTHKLESIEKILNTYTNLPFVLIGDNGESDPQIYTEIVRKFPARIKIIYIRNVRTEPEKLIAISVLVKEVAQSDVQLVLAEDTEFAAIHAASEGLIDTDELEKIRLKKKIDQNLSIAK